MRYAVVILAWLALACGANAQNLLLGAGQSPKVAAAAGYTGPGDIVSGAKVWYGLRAYNAADRGNKLVNVCNVI